MSPYTPEVQRLIDAAAAHVDRAKEKHGIASPDDCYEPTMAELWRALDALGIDPPRFTT